VRAQIFEIDVLAARHRRMHEIAVAAPVEEARHLPAGVARDDLEATGEPTLEHCGILIVSSHQVERDDIDVLRGG